MNQEKIGLFIKNLRKSNNLSQQSFAEKLGVTFQAVSKWENGKNLPDMSTLKEISRLFNVNIDEIINGENNKKKKINKKYIIISLIGISLIIIISLILIFLNNKDTSFSFNEISTTNNYFSLSGSVVLSKKRTSLIINNVTYKGKPDNTIYKNLSCDLYENIGDTKKLISSCDSASNETLKEYLESVKIKMDHYSSECKMFNKSHIFIEINVISNDGEALTYNIPIEIKEDDCF